ncbi:MAG: response regulator transcription factor [Bacteroidales bacterium]|nr:response regulator transcription factor [Bacteroidales bacterium]
MNNKAKILIVDDEPDIVELLSYNLKNSGFITYNAFDGEEAIKIALKEKPDVILLDIIMPKLNGFEVCKRLRAIEDFKLNKAIIIFLTAKNDEFSHIKAFEFGADDFITKPISLPILFARINNLLKRSKQFNTSEEKLFFENIIIDKNRYSVTIDNKEIKLPRKEFELLFLLASKPNQVIPREHLYDVIWGEDVIVTDRTIDVHIRKLRQKIGDKYIETIKGVGYMFSI